MTLPRELVSAVRNCRNEGMRRADAAKKLGITDNKIRSICGSYKIYGWPIGAASHNQNGAANPNYGGGNSRSTIRRITKKVLNNLGRDLFTCERCGLTREVELPRHHKDRNRKNNHPDNLEILCVSCHNKDHMPERIRIKGRLI